MLQVTHYGNVCSRCDNRKTTVIIVTAILKAHQCPGVRALPGRGPPHRAAAAHPGGPHGLGGRASSQPGAGHSGVRWLVRPVSRVARGLGSRLLPSCDCCCFLLLPLLQELRLLLLLLLLLPLLL